MVRQVLRRGEGQVLKLRQSVQPGGIIPVKAAPFPQPRERLILTVKLERLQIFPGEPGDRLCFFDPPV